MPIGQATQANSAVPYTTDPNVPGGQVHVVVATGAEIVGPGHEFLRPFLQMKFAGQSLHMVSFLALHGFEINLPDGHCEQPAHVRLSPLVTWRMVTSANILARTGFMNLVIFGYM